MTVPIVLKLHPDTVEAFHCCSMCSVVTVMGNSRNSRKSYDKQILKITPSVFAEHFSKETPLCSAALYSVQECTRSAVCVTVIYHYHHHYHDVLSVWQSACNMSDNSSYWSCFSMKQIITAGRERQLGFKKAPDVAKTAFKLLFVAS